MRHFVQMHLLRLLACAVLACGIAGFALAAKPESTPAIADLEQVFVLEASGTLVVAPDGSVSEATVETEFDDAVRSALARSVGRLRFEPVLVDGKAVAARSGFHAVLIGRKQGDRLAVTMDSLDFRAPKGEKVSRDPGAMTPITERSMAPPKYPTGPERSGIMGKVKIVLRVGADGRTADVCVVDSQIWNTGVSPVSARSALHLLELEALRAARQWTFNVPADATRRSGKEMTVATSVAFVFKLRKGVSLDKEGQWLPIFKAPKREVAWLPPADSRRFADTALASGSVSGASPFELLTPVGGTAVF